MQSIDSIIFQELNLMNQNFIMNILCPVCWVFVFAFRFLNDWNFRFIL